LFLPARHTNLRRPNSLIHLITLGKWSFAMAAARFSAITSRLVHTARLADDPEAVLVGSANLFSICAPIARLPRDLSPGSPLSDRVGIDNVFQTKSSVGARFVAISDTGQHSLKRRKGTYGKFQTL